MASIVLSHILLPMEEEGDLQDITMRLASIQLGIPIEKVYALANVSTNDIDTETFVHQQVSVNEEGYIYNVSLKNNQGKILAESSSAGKYCIRMVTLGDKTVTIPLDLSLLTVLTNIVHSPKAAKRKAKR